MFDVNWGGQGYSDYAGFMQSGKKSYGEKLGYQKQSEADTKGNAIIDSSTAADDKTLSDLDYFTGSDPTQTGLYHSLTKSGIESTNKSYDNAAAANRLHSKVAGFGYETPIGAATDATTEQARASDLSKVSDTALVDTIQPEMTALGLRSGIAGRRASTGLGLTGQGLNYFNGANNAEQTRLGRNAQQKQQMGSAASQALMMALLASG